MKHFDTIAITRKGLEKELKEFETLLRKNRNLEERNDIQPFLKKRRMLSAAIGHILPISLNPDLIAYEFDLFGEFVCDIVVGDSESNKYLLIELEDGKTTSIFKKLKAKETPEWNTRLEHGISQVVDWYHTIDLERNGPKFPYKFKTAKAQLYGLVVIGRQAKWEEREHRRFMWRQEKTVINSDKIAIMNYDEIARVMRVRLNVPKDKRI
ncbi:MAG: DUF4263 domain-containing protein [Fibrobacteres bacterium]|nr:DUF4263 domain-containing protein [Fibrobacterota bacterium]